MADKPAAPGEVFDDNEHIQYFYHADHLGSASYVTDALGQVSQHVQYYPFGETWVEEHSNRQRTPFLFTGKELDEETGLYYFGARYYDPRTSVWQSPDPILSDYLKGERSGEGVFTPVNLNLYGYSHQRPAVMRDPDGNETYVAISTGADSHAGFFIHNPQTNTYLIYDPGGSFTGKFGDGSSRPMGSSRTFSGNIARQNTVNYLNYQNAGDATTIVRLRTTPAEASALIEAADNYGGSSAFFCTTATSSVLQSVPRIGEHVSDRWLPSKLLGDFEEAIDDQGPIEWLLSSGHPVDWIETMTAPQAIQDVKRREVEAFMNATE